MSIKKITLAIVSVMLAFVLMIIPNSVKAATNLTTPIYFGIREFRDGTTPSNMAYAINDPRTNGASVSQINGLKIWEIVKHNSNSASSTATVGDYYCVRAGVGFSDTTKIATYNISYDLKTEATAIAASGNRYLKALVENGYFNHLLALTDLLYLKDSSTPAERTALLTAAGIDAEDYPGEYAITDSDIEAVQQAAIWYFTNHDDTFFERVLNNINKTSWLYYNTSERSQTTPNYAPLSDYGPKFNSQGKQIYIGDARNDQAIDLYRYLINTATQNASKYANGTAVSKSKVTLYTNATIENTQPVILIEKQPEGEFDLALRKYITKVDGIALSGNDSRVPNIDENTLRTGKTATYKHKKDPVEVKTGSVITYNLTVYNEGDKAGRATKIIDQLPTGLKYSKINTNGFTVNYNEGTNILTITRDANNTTNLDPYRAENLKSETIEIECIVTATAPTGNVQNTTLTNVAWIAEEYDAVDNKTITNEQGADRDSEPATKPNVNKDNMSNYEGNGNKSDLTDKDYYYKGQQDDDDFEKLILKNLSFYNVVLVKEDANGEQLNETATFEVNGRTVTVTGRLTIAENVEITTENVSTPDVYVIKELIPPDEYCKFDGIITATVTKKLVDGVPQLDQITYKVTDVQGNELSKDGADVYLNDDGNIYVEVVNYQFDLKIIKRIVEVNGVKVPERIEDVDITKLANGTATTADYKLNKNPVTVSNGDIVKYTFRVYNEGQLDGYASEITEDIPEGLEFIWSEKTVEELESNTELSQEEKDAIKYNQLLWTMSKVNRDTNRVEEVKTDYLAKGKGEEIVTTDANLIKAFDKTKTYINTINSKNPDYKEVSIYLKVVAQDTSKDVIRNEAAITGNTDKDGKPVKDRDSNPDNWVKYEDDEDYDRIKLGAFDMALRKFIVALSADENIEDSEYIKDSNGLYKRAPQVDTSKLNTIDEDGNIITTAIYNHTKEPLEVSVNSYVVYMLRVYNEGDMSGYASEIKDYLPEYLDFVNSEFNSKYGWEISSEGRVISTKYLKDQLIEKISTSEDAKIVLSYKEVPVMCKVNDKAQRKDKITNIAEIAEIKDENREPVVDRDSQPGNITIPDDKDLPNYKDNEKGNYIPGQQDDDDFEKIVVKIFDLSLRKWVTHAIVVENGKESVTSTGHKAEDDPEQVVKIDLNKKNLDKVAVKFKYSIRVTNEGDIAGYAKEITDYVPEGLKFVAADNKNWAEKGNNVIATRELETKLLQPGESAEVQVILTWINSKDNMGLKKNVAEISEDYNDKGVPDIDSIPGNRKDGEDDIDDAPVLLSLKTGEEQLYLSLGFSVLSTLGGGIFLIKRYVI